MDIHGSLREGDDTRVNIDELHSITRSFEWTIVGLQQDTIVRVYPKPNFGFVNSTIEGHSDGDQSRASIMSGSARVSRDEGFTNPKITDHELRGPTSVPKLTLQNLKSVLSTYDSGVHLNNMKNYEAFNITLPSVEGVAEFFGVPLIMQVDYENFAKGIETGTYEVWFKLTSKQRNAILKTTSTGWKALMDLKSATPDLGGNSQLGETWAKEDYDKYQRFLFLEIDSRAGLEAVLEGLVDIPIVEKTNDGFQTVGKKKKRKGKSKSINGA
nr:hypothetical protein [Tanacetum cinerariifolium]